MKKPIYEYSDETNAKLLQERGIGFEEIIVAIECGAILDILPHPKSAK